MAVVRKVNFVGGLNQQLDPTKLDPNTDFYLALNARLRRNVIDPVRLPVDITGGLPTTGVLQGLFAADSVLLAFVSGVAYYREMAGTGGWNLVAGYTMSATAERVWCELLPASTVNYARVPSTTNANDGVDLVIGTPRYLSPQCVIVMDGESQPCVIFADGTARKTQNYSQWTNTTDGAEYVPIARMPLYYNGKLYCIGKGVNGYWNQLFHSVSGRPLDFMIAINKDGNKTDADENKGGAPQLAGGFSYGDVTALRAIPSVDGAFFGSTARASVLVQPNYNNTIFAEPTFNYQSLFSIGALNDLCIVDALGDTAVIHYNGIRSFNGVVQAKWEGKNAPFSARIGALTDGIQQQYACCASFDNYCGFALMTKHGPGILWYDTLIERFVSLDIYPGVAQIRQFAEIKTATAQRLFFSTVDNKLYEAFAGETTANCGVYFLDLSPQAGAPAQHRITTVNCVFSDLVEDGYVQCEAFHDRRKSITQAQKLTASSASPSVYTSIPFDPTVDNDTIVTNFNFTDSAEYAWRAGAMLTWDARATLLELAFETDEKLSPSPDRQVARTVEVVTPTRFSFLGDDGLLSPDRFKVFGQIAEANPDCVIGLGDHAYTSGTHSQVSTRLKDYWERARAYGKFYAVPGNHDLDTNKGAAFFQYMRQPPTNYFVKRIGEFTDVFFIVSGWNTAGVQQFPFNSYSVDMRDAEQFVWLKAALAESTARFKFVVWHEPMYTSGAVHAARTELQVIPLKQWGAHALLCGHNHQYERIVRDGFTYYIVGTGGSSLYDFADPPDSGSCARIKSFGRLNCTVNPLSAEFVFVDDNGEEHDSWIIRR